MDLSTTSVGRGSSCAIYATAGDSTRDVRLYMTESCKYASSLLEVLTLLEYSDNVAHQMDIIAAEAEGRG